MSLIVKDSSKEPMALVPEGVYIATCYAITDLGTHYNPAFDNASRKVLIQFELPDVRCDVEREGKTVSLPRAISKRYTLSLSDKANLRRDLESWRGRRFTPAELSGFDLKAVLGASCQLQVVHAPSKDGRIFASIGAIMALPKGMKAPAAENPLQFFSFDEAGPRPVLPVNLPEWIGKIVQESKEWRTAYAATPAPAAAAPASTPAPAAVDAVEDEEPLPF